MLRESESAHQTHARQTRIPERYISPKLFKKVADVPPNDGAGGSEKAKSQEKMAGAPQHRKADRRKS